MSFTGGCRCGACRYTLARETLPPIVCCHCRDCQTWSGSAFSMQAFIAQVEITATGPVVDYVHDSRSGATSTQMVCGICHTRLWATSSARPGTAAVRAGTLDDSDNLSPRLHIWVKRKQPWIVIDDQVPTYPEAPPREAVAALSKSEAN